MRRAVLLVAVAAVAPLAAASPSTARRVACTAGVQTVAGVSYRTFCGPAKASAHAPGLLFGFKDGGCTISGGFFTINIGTITLGSSPPKYAYFGITVFGKRQGTYKNAAVAWQEPGKRYGLMKTTVRLKAGLTGGTFQGSLLGGGSATGSFSCR
jgi:hypothetical protein